MNDLIWTGNSIKLTIEMREYYKNRLGVDEVLVKRWIAGECLPPWQVVWSVIHFLEG